MPKLTDARYEENFPGANFTPAEAEFIMAMDRYMTANRRKFPTWHEVLKVLLSLGYRKPEAEAQPERTFPEEFPRGVRR
ncbi:MAG: hypothetical protein N2112_07950 [Gemmataceae bacterium]|nr:hypothetical protein [Gemmataceae bacterium]